jgi:hypothetical protein
MQLETGPALSAPTGDPSFSFFSSFSFSFFSFSFLFLARGLDGHAARVHGVDPLSLPPVPAPASTPAPDIGAREGGRRATLERVLALTNIPPLTFLPARASRVAPLAASLPIPKRGGCSCPFPAEASLASPSPKMSAARQLYSLKGSCVGMPRGMPRHAFSRPPSSPTPTSSNGALSPVTPVLLPRCCRLRLMRPSCASHS